MSFLWWILTSVVTVIPLWILAPNYRLPPFAALVALIPFGSIVLLYVFAFRDSLKIPGIDK